MRLKATIVLVVVVLISSGTFQSCKANLCVLCQSLRDHLPTEFHSCVLRNFEIKHCNESFDTHLSALKIVGVKRIIRVNYEEAGNVFWEVGVNVLQDSSYGDSHHHVNNGNNSSSSSSSSSNGHEHLIQLAVIRFKSYPYSLLLQNPCRHVLGTINYNSFYSGGKKRPGASSSSATTATHHNAVPTTTISQRISPAYFVIDDKVCREGSAVGHRGIGVRRRCTPIPPQQLQPNTQQNVSLAQQHQQHHHPYECCTPLKSNECSSSPLPHQPSSDEHEQSYLRPLTLGIQCVAIGFSLMLSAIVVYIRKSKVIQVSVWPLTESIIFGSTLIYASVAIRCCIKFDVGDAAPTQYEDGRWWNEHKDKEPDQGKYWGCLAEPWCRELGFTFVYGGIVLKIYRSLVEFRTRKAHRWVVREKDILRYLGTTVAVVLFYLIAWSVTVGEFGQQGGSGIDDGEDPSNNQVVCPGVTNWHRVTEVGELLYIAVGLNMAWLLRTSPVSPFLERQMYTAALILEATASVLLIVIRECKLFFSEENDNNQHDGFLLLLYFIRCHVTTTVILALVLGPKLYFVYVDAASRKRSGALRRGDTLTTTAGGGGGGGSTVGGAGGIISSGGLTGPPTSASLSNLAKIGGPPHALVGVDHHTLIDLDFAEVSLAEMDPQDIKMELKRVYTQLELLRNKTMRKDNPHISKRRGGRKPTHRRFSLQKKGSRDKTAAATAAMRNRMQALDQEGRHNRFSGRYNDDIEDSVCSIEGPSTYSEVGGGYR